MAGQAPTVAIGVATDAELEWLNGELDPEAVARLDPAYFEAAENASPTPPHWRFPKDGYQ